MTRDTFDQFQQPDRGRFGDDEEAPQHRSHRGPKVTGSSDLVDLDMVLHIDMNRTMAVLCSFGERRKAYWLPRSEIEFLKTGPVERKAKSFFDQKVRVTLPRWLAEKKGLV
jgi:hypothetical protein